MLFSCTLTYYLLRPSPWTRHTHPPHSRYCDVAKVPNVTQKVKGCMRTLCFVSYEEDLGIGMSLILLAWFVLPRYFGSNPCAFPVCPLGSALPLILFFHFLFFLLFCAFCVYHTLYPYETHWDTKRASRSSLKKGYLFHVS